ncbi:MAG: phosphodiester glycosidase family protein, partial [Parachlamydiales bacterium]|nr:phosphodiester glycosidase family protein [Parachlamydiales bacterium]
KRIITYLILSILLTSFVDFDYKHIQTNDPLSIHILEINPKKYKIQASLAIDKKISKDTVLNIAKNKNAKAAVNGGFFKTGSLLDGFPMGALKIENFWLTLPFKSRGAIGFDKNCKTFLMDRIFVDVYAILNNQKILIGNFNHYLHKLNLFENNNLEIFVNPILNPQNYSIWNDFETVVGGTPLLIFEGEKIKDFSEEKTLLSFLTDRHARTAIGIKDNNNLTFVVVDKNYDSSLGMTIEELQNFMYEIGCTNALNLDGGGSSCMVIDNKIINKPRCDENDFENIRKVSNVILILEK